MDTPAFSLLSPVLEILQLIKTKYIIRFIENSLKAASIEYLSVFNIALLRIQYISEQTNESMRCNHLLHLGLLRDSLSNFDILVHAAYMRFHHPTSSFVAECKGLCSSIADIKDDRAFSLLHQEFHRFWYYASLSTCCQNLEKNWDHRENFGRKRRSNF